MSIKNVKNYNKQTIKIYKQRVKTMYFKDLQTTLQNLKNERITYKKIASALGVTIGAVSQRLKNDKSQVRLDEIKKLENYFAVNLQNPDEVYNYNRALQRSADIMNSVGERLQAVRKYLNLLVTDVAKELNIKPRTLGAYERNENYPPAVFFSKFFEKYNVNPDYILQGYEPMFKESEKNSMFDNDIIEIERVDGIRPECGKGSDCFTEPYIEPFRISRRSIMDYLRCTSPENLKTFRASGDSMEDKISDGDWLLVDLGRRDATVSGVYIFTANGLCRCKRLNMTLDGRLEVKSDNPKYAMEIVGPNDNIEINIIGRVLNNLSRGL